MVDRLRPPGNEVQKEALTRHIQRAKLLASQPTSGITITPLQVDNVVNHMFVAVTYWMSGPEEYGTEQYVKGAAGVIGLAGAAIGTLNEGVGKELIELGHAMRHGRIAIVQELALSAGFDLRKAPEDSGLYERIARGEMDQGLLVDWLMNVPEEPNIR